MQVNTKPYGLIDVDERQRIHFPFGLLGFERLRAFVLLDASQAPFYWLQSEQEAGIAFVLIDPKFFRPDYVLDVAPFDLEEIGLSGDSELLTFSIVTIPENQELMTANLQGPVLIDRKRRVGRQSINLNPEWKVRHYILDELAHVRDAAC